MRNTPKQMHHDTKMVSITKGLHVATRVGVVVLHLP